MSRLALHQRLPVVFCCLLFYLCTGMVLFGNTVYGAPLLLVSDGQKNDALQTVLDALGRQQAQIVNIQRELVSRPAIGPECGGHGEEEKARWVKSWFHERGIFCELLEFPDERVSGGVRPNLVAVYPKSPTASGKTLWLLGHLDVAPAGERGLWHSDPFALRVDGDVMYGRGTEDNNQAVATSLVLMDVLQRNNITPPTRLGVILTSAALTDYTIGIQHVLDRKRDLFRPGDQVVVMDFGNAEGVLAGVGEKGNLWLKIAVEGKVGHAANPERAVNAFAAAATLVHELRDLYKEFPAEDSLFFPPHTTITPTRTEGTAIGINHIPGEFVFYLDARVMADYSFDAVEAAVLRLADAASQRDGVQISIERVEATPASRVTPVDSPVLQSLKRAVRAQLGGDLVVVGTGGVTTASFIREKGIPVAVWGVQENQRNSINEYALISAHIKQAQVAARMLFE